MTSPTTSLDRAAICARLPHGDGMVMLDAVTNWDAAQINCASMQHAETGNPLRQSGRLHAISGIEFAAQAIALHGLLKARPGGQVQAAAIAGLKSVSWSRPYLDDANGPLAISARAAAQLGDGAQYRFEIRDGSGLLLVEGQALVVFSTSDIHQG